MFTVASSKKSFTGIKGSSEGTRPEDEKEYWFEEENAIDTSVGQMQIMHQVVSYFFSIHCTSKSDID